MILSLSTQEHDRSFHIQLYIYVFQEHFIILTILVSVRYFSFFYLLFL